MVSEIRLRAGALIQLYYTKILLNYYIALRRTGGLDLMHFVCMRTSAKLEFTGQV
jgi:hypothetical protein